jgi:hypothetical protein
VFVNPFQQRLYKVCCLLSCWSASHLLRPSLVCVPSLGAVLRPRFWLPAHMPLRCISQNEQTRHIKCFIRLARRSQNSSWGADAVRECERCMSERGDV